MQTSSTISEKIKCKLIRYSLSPRPWLWWETNTSCREAGGAAQLGFPLRDRPQSAHSRAGRQGPITEAATLAWKGQPSGWGGDALPHFLPICGWPGAPAASTGNNRGPQRPPRQPSSRPPRGGRGHCRPLFQFPQITGAHKASPTRSCPASPSPTLGTGPPGPWALKAAGAVENEVSSKVGVGAHVGQACRQN